MSLFKKKTKSKLGIDIGTSSIKVVQLSKEGGKFKLETYGELSFLGYLEKNKESFQTTSLKTLEIVTREMLKIVLSKAEASAKNIVLAVPVFSSFTSAIELPDMPEKELTRAIEFEARKYVPVPISEVSLDWKIIETGIIKDGATRRPFKGKRILLIAVPNEVINKYVGIADALGLKIDALELESSSLARSLVVDKKSSVCILDIGARATSFTIVDKGMVQISHSLDVAGGEMTKALARAMGVGIRRAEDIKLKHGLDHKENNEPKGELQDILQTSIDKIIDESERLINSYQAKTNRKIEQLILNGGSAKLTGFGGRVEKRLNMKAVIADPWSKIIYPAPLQPTLKKIGPGFSVAVGAAMRDGQK